MLRNVPSANRRVCRSMVTKALGGDVSLLGPLIGTVFISTVLTIVSTKSSRSAMRVLFACSHERFSRQRNAECCNRSA